MGQSLSLWMGLAFVSQGHTLSPELLGLWSGGPSCASVISPAREMLKLTLVPDMSLHLVQLMLRRSGSPTARFE